MKLLPTFHISREKALAYAFHKVNNAPIQGAHTGGPPKTHKLRTPFTVKVTTHVRRVVIAP